MLTMTAWLCEGMKLNPLSLWMKRSHLRTDLKKSPALLHWPAQGSFREAGREEECLEEDFMQDSCVQIPKHSSLSEHCAYCIFWLHPFSFISLTWVRPWSRSSATLAVPDQLIHMSWQASLLTSPETHLTYKSKANVLQTELPGKSFCNNSKETTGCQDSYFAILYNHKKSQMRYWTSIFAYFALIFLEQDKRLMCLWYYSLYIIKMWLTINHCDSMPIIQKHFWKIKKEKDRH